MPVENHVVKIHGTSHATLVATQQPWSYWLRYHGGSLGLLGFFPCHNVHGKSLAFLPTVHLKVAKVPLHDLTTNQGQ